MDYQIGSRNILLVALTVSLLYVSFTKGASFILQKDTATICSNGRNLTVVIQSHDAQTVLFPSKSLKDTLDCLGKGMAFYDRTIEYVHLYGISPSYSKELSKRYQLATVSSSPTFEAFDSISASKDTVSIESKRRVLIFRTVQNNPFSIRTLAQSTLAQDLYFPETGDTVLLVLRRLLGDEGVTLMQVKEGDWTQINL